MKFCSIRLFLFKILFFRVYNDGEMTPISWTEVEGQKFLVEEAGEASNFSEVVGNFSLSPEEAYEMFKNDGLSVGKRLYFAACLPPEKATILLLLDPDSRISQIVSSRLKKEKEKANGSIIAA